MRTMDGIEVMDAPYDWPLVISDKQAKDGIPMDVERCPAALACLEIPGWKRAKVYKSRLLGLTEFEERDVWFRFVVPKSLMIQEAIIDNGGKFSPGTYILKAPKGSKRTGKQQGSDTRPPKDENKSKREYHKTPMRVNAPTAST